MLVADVAGLLALYVVPLPVINVMGGIPEEQEIAFAALVVTGLCWLTLPLWLVMAVIAVRSPHNQPRWQVSTVPDESRRSVIALLCAVLVLISWLALLPFTQPEQLLARRVEQVYRKEGPAAAVALMSARDRAAFPPDWKPPPRTSLGNPPPSQLLDALEALSDHPHANWLEKIYAERFRDTVLHHAYDYEEQGRLVTEHAVRLATILGKLREGPDLARFLRFDIESRLEGDRAALSSDQRTALETLLRLAGPRDAPDSHDASTTSSP
jgi:hypothetical protein